MSALDKRETSKSKDCMKRPACAAEAKAPKPKACMKPQAAKRPSYSIEHSRSQVLYRSGMSGKGQSKGLKYHNDASKRKATDMAQKLVSAECKRRGLSWLTLPAPRWQTHAVT